MNRHRFLGRSPYEPIWAWERIGIALLFVLVVAFGGITLQRSAFLKQRRTDADVYFRAAWALRTDQDPYAVKDTNGWTYLYPPPLAILAMPLAQEPPPNHPSGQNLSDAQRLSWGVPYPVAVLIWYSLSAVLLVLSSHWIASALEACSPHALVRSAPARTRRWWMNRLIPVAVCLPAIGSTMVRGQVNVLLLASICGASLLIARRRPFAAGATLSVAVCLKLFPGFLLLYALLTRSWRMVVGCALASLAWLVALPIVVVGPARTWELLRTFVYTMLLPALGIGGDEAKKEELARAFNNQSLLAILHNWRNWHGVTVDHIILPNAFDKAVFLVIALALTGGLILAAIRAGLGKSEKLGQSGDLSAAWTGTGLRARLLVLALLATLMLVLSPVCHNHYFTLHLPLIACLVSLAMDRSRTVDLSGGVWLGLLAYFAMAVLPRLPGLEPALKPAGVQMLAGVVLFLTGLWTLRRLPRAGIPYTA